VPEADGVGDPEGKLKTTIYLFLYSSKEEALNFKYPKLFFAIYLASGILGGVIISYYFNTKN
jgi:hypothetical protein